MVLFIVWVECDRVVTSSSVLKDMREKLGHNAAIVVECITNNTYVCDVNKVLKLQIFLSHFLCNLVKEQILLLRSSRKLTTE
jgi:hypothetical protein